MIIMRRTNMPYQCCICKNIFFQPDKNDIFSDIEQGNFYVLYVHIYIYVVGIQLRNLC